MNTATYIKDVNPNASGYQRLYHVSPPIEGYRSDENDAKLFYDYVVVSAATVPYSGPETYIFASDEHGKVQHWMELPGSYRGGLKHEQALQRAGYTVVDSSL